SRKSRCMSMTMRAVASRDRPSKGNGYGSDLIVIMRNLPAAFVSSSSQAKIGVKSNFVVDYKIALRKLGIIAGRQGNNGWVERAPSARALRADPRCRHRALCRAGLR